MQYLVTSICCKNSLATVLLREQLCHSRHCLLECHFTKSKSSFICGKLNGNQACSHGHQAHDEMPKIAQVLVC